MHIIGFRASQNHNKIEGINGLGKAMILARTIQFLCPNKTGDPIA
jgi:hypothetical protein